MFDYIYIKVVLYIQMNREVFVMSENLREQAYNATTEIIEVAGLKRGQLLVVGCSTSEILGSKIGTDSSPDTAKEVFDGIYTAAEGKGIFFSLRRSFGEYRGTRRIYRTLHTPYRFSARQGQDNTFKGVPPPYAQNAGVSLARSRPLSHAPDTHA